MFSFLHMTITPPTIDAPTFLGSVEISFEQQFRSKLNLHAEDWLMYQPNCYIIFSNKRSGEWADLLAPLLKANGRLFICKLDLSDRQGSMPSEFWAWINSKFHNAAYTPLPFDSKNQKKTFPPSQAPRW